MIRTSFLVFALVAALSVHAELFAQTDTNSGAVRSDTLGFRLNSAKHVGVSIDERLSGYVLYLYPPTQRAQNLASLAAYRKNLETYNALKTSGDDKRRASQQRRAPLKEHKAIMEEGNRLMSKRPNSPFSRSVVLYDIVHHGVDYIEMRRAEKSGETVLIPFSKIRRIIVVTSDEDFSEGGLSDAPKSR